MAKRIRVLLVDDQKLFVESLRLVIDSRSNNLEVVGVAYDGESALEMVEQLHPDLVVLDVRMPGMGGVETVKHLSKRYPDLRVLMLTTFDDDQEVSQALRYGAIGYLLKDMSPDDLMKAMQSATSESLQISSSIIHKMLERGLAQEESTTPSATFTIEAAESKIGKITPREEDILHLIADGYNNTEIAEKLQIAVQTVKNRVSELYFKFEVHDRLHLMRKAKQLDFGHTS